jgi:hypothetical protein
VGEVQLVVVDNGDGTVTRSSADYPECPLAYAATDSAASLLGAQACEIANGEEHFAVTTRASTLTLTSASTLDVHETWDFSGTELRRVDGQVQSVSVAGKAEAYAYCTSH